MMMQKCRQQVQVPQVQVGEVQVGEVRDVNSNVNSANSLVVIVSYTYKIVNQYYYYPRIIIMAQLL